MTRTQQKPKAPHAETAAQRRRDRSADRKAISSDWPMETAPRRVKLAQLVDASGVDPRKLDEIDAFDWKGADIDWDDPQDEEPEWYGDHMLVTDDPPAYGYGMLRGVAVLEHGFGFDAVFGEGYLGGNCGFSVKSRP